MTKEQAEEAAQWMEGRASQHAHMAEGHRGHAEPGAAEECEERALRYRRVALALRSHWPMLEALEACERWERATKSLLAGKTEGLAREARSKVAAALTLARKEP